MKINQAIKNRLDEITITHESIKAQMSDEKIVSDHQRYQELSKEFAQINPVVESYQKYQHTLKEIDELKLLINGNDKEMQEIAASELPDTQKLAEQQEQDLCILLLPKDPDDECNAFVEIRAGTGGLEAGLFVGDLFRMYTRYAEIRNWKSKVISCHENESGGFKEIIIHVIGKAVYEVLKYESGTHRVQRIPATESQGRVHTSACTIAVMPEIKQTKVFHIDPSELRIDTYRASGAGGQHVNKTDSAVRITHIPTNTVVECQDERSQHKNKAKALSLLETKIISAQQAKQKAEESQQRKLMVGSGDRSERIRTYNFPQGRLTDHRINLTLYCLADIMEGNIDQVLVPLRQQDQLDQMADFK